MNKKYSLKAEIIKANYENFMRKMEDLFPTRFEQIKEIYKTFGEERVMFAPGSGTNHFHNAIPGGYLDHVLRVMDFAEKKYKFYEENGLDVSNFTVEELLFAAAHHDLGKLGYIGDGKENYVPNPSDWHVKNQGKIYDTNENIPYMAIQDRSLFLLQQFGIKCTHNEWLAIKIHDGVYDDSNVSYYKSWSLKNKLRNNMPQILHEADMAAARFEFEKWFKTENTFNTSNINFDNKVEKVSKVTEEKEEVKKDEKNMSDIFDSIFG